MKQLRKTLSLLCVLAMALMGYLMSPRAVGLLHALPVRRGTPYLDQALRISGLSRL